MEFLAFVVIVFVAFKGIKFYLSDRAAQAAALAEQLRAEAAAKAERVARLMTTEEGRFQLHAENQALQHAETLKALERQHAEKSAEDARRHERELAALKLCGMCGDAKDSRGHLNNCRAA